ncbi:cysteine hydrolase family protein [Bacillus songklensis]|uniref:Cysteine hydrolase family protein n=1 Tax=Bacillus songklensis TaxID=1069116 RepID=A0ABV8B8D4_9BACI
MSETALLLIDVQNDYFPGGKMELDRSEETACNAKKVLDHFRRKKLSILHIQHLSTREGANFFLPDTNGCEFHELVIPQEDEFIIQKHFPNSFRDTGLLSTLKKKNVQHLVIAGMMSHMCVDSTVRAAFDLGFRCTVIEDACTTRDLSLYEKQIPALTVHQSIMAALSGLYAKVTRADNWIRESTR